MATIHKRKDTDYQWQAKVRRKGYPAQSKTFETKAEAEAWARKIEGAMDDGSFRPLGESQRFTVADMLERYVEEVSRHKAAYRTDRSRANVIKDYPLAQYAIANVSGKQLAEFRDARLKEVSARTVQYDLTTIGHAFSVAVKDWGYILPRGNPVDEVRKPRVGNNGRDRRLKPGEEDLLLAACSEYGGDIQAIVRLALETAMRQGELAKLRWEHVSIVERTIRLPRENTKTNTDRNIPLSSRAVAVLEALPRRLDGRVFGMSQDSIKQAFRRCCARAKDGEGKPAPITNLRFHDLRHEATSRLFERGLNPMQVASITGHKSLQMLKRYTHLKAEDLAKMLG